MNTACINYGISLNNLVLFEVILLGFVKPDLRFNLRFASFWR